LEKPQKNIWLELADDLASLLEGSVSSEFVKEKYFHQEVSDEFDHVMCRLAHFLDDGDIRDRDERYKKMQNKEMRKLIRLIRSGDYTEASLVHFLGESEV